jgi:hypothetical protein
LLPHAPQLLESVISLTHWPFGQSSSPPEQQFEFWQDRPGGQTLLHEPQLVESLVSSTQTPLHSVCSALTHRHAGPPAPCWQVVIGAPSGPLRHALPQPPQFALLLVRSAQTLTPSSLQSTSAPLH